MSNDLVARNDVPAVSGDSGEVSADFLQDDGAFQLPSLTAERRAEIEHVRKTDINRYFKEGLDQELFQCLKEDLGEATPTDPLSPEEGRQQLTATEAGKKLVSGWDRAGFAKEYKFVQETVGKIVRGIGGAREQRVFMEKFDRVIPEDLRCAIFDMITTSGNDSFVRPVTDDQVELFKKSGPTCPQLVEKWGKDAPTHIARIWRRAEYLKMSCDDITPIVDWLSIITDTEAKAVLEFASR